MILPVGGLAGWFLRFRITIVRYDIILIHVCMCVYFTYMVPGQLPQGRYLIGPTFIATYNHGMLSAGYGHIWLYISREVGVLNPSTHT